MKVASTYLKFRYLALCWAIRHNWLWIRSSWKVVLALTLRPGDLFFDVGANIGLVTQVGTWLVGQRGRVHSFEPSPSIARHLRQRVTLLNLQNVVVNEFALGEAHRTAFLYEHAENHGGASSLLPDAKPKHAYSAKTRVAVEVLDDYVDKHSFGPIRLIKIDVEGSEIDVLRGGKRLLTAQHPVLFVEVSRQTTAASGRSINELLGVITDLGYKMFSWRTEGLVAVRSETDIPPAWHHDDVICLDMIQHNLLYRHLLRLSERRKSK